MPVTVASPGSRAIACACCRAIWPAPRIPTRSGETGVIADETRLGFIEVRSVWSGKESAVASDRHQCRLRRPIDPGVRNGMNPSECKGNAVLELCRCSNAEVFNSFPHL